MKQHLSFSKLYINGVRRLHLLVLMAVFVPFFCQITTLGSGADALANAAGTFGPLYGLTLTLAVPVIFIFFVQEKVSSLWTFLLYACPVSLLYLAGLFSFENALGLSTNNSEKIPQALILLLYLFDAIQMRTNDNSRKKAKNENDISWREDQYLLPLPALQFLILFALLYVVALLFHSNELAHVTLIGTIQYFFLVFPYLLLSRREDYLEDRHNVHRIPTGLISSLQGKSMIRVLIPCALFAAAAVMTSSGRQFLTLPPITYSGGKYPTYKPCPMPFWVKRNMFLVELMKKSGPPPQWLVEIYYFIDNVVTLLILALLAYALYRAVRGIVIRFGYLDKSVPIQAKSLQTVDEHISLKKEHARFTLFDRTDGVRRRYKKTILRYRGEAPDISETPERMEKLANLPDTPDMRALHEEYEKVRYSSRE